MVKQLSPFIGNLRCVFYRVLCIHVPLKYKYVDVKKFHLLKIDELLCKVLW